LIAVYPGDIIPERRAKSSRNAERHQIGLASNIIPDSRATSPGISSWTDEVTAFAATPTTATSMFAAAAPVNG
jgi:hypothetical protein